MAISSNMTPIMSAKMRAGNGKGCLPSAVAILQFQNPVNVWKKLFPHGDKKEACLEHQELRTSGSILIK